MCNQPKNKRISIYPQEYTSIHEDCQDIDVVYRLIILQSNEDRQNPSIIQQYELEVKYMQMTTI